MWSRYCPSSRPTSPKRPLRRTEKMREKIALAGGSSLRSVLRNYRMVGTNLAGHSAQPRVYTHLEARSCPMG